MNNNNVIKAVVNQPQKIVSVIKQAQLKADLDFSTVVISPYPAYTGETTAYSRAMEEQTLQTANKTVYNNIVIKPNVVLITPNPNTGGNIYQIL